MILLLDNFDSFTYNLVDYFEQLGVHVKVIRNDARLEDIISSQPKAIILSPGPQTPSKAGCLMEVIKHYHRQIPMLGICLGHQAIGEFFGMKLIKSPLPRHGKVAEIFCESVVLFSGIPDKIKVVQYNSLILENHDLDEIRIIARTKDNEVMGIQHESLPLTGVQFHPEAALTEYGLQIFKNWLDCNNLK